MSVSISSITSNWDCKWILRLELIGSAGLDCVKHINHELSRSQQLLPEHQPIDRPFADKDFLLSSYRNWKTFDERSFDFCQGITLHHLPGHTDGLIGMQINLPDSGTIFFISDHCHVIENVSLLVLLDTANRVV
jgi:glyoxylase-like metal-dependent hydrolase (beta-lactamase superfamily II)